MLRFRRSVENIGVQSGHFTGASIVWCKKNSLSNWSLAYELGYSLKANKFKALRIRVVDSTNIIVEVCTLGQIKEWRYIYGSPVFELSRVHIQSQMFLCSVVVNLLWSFDFADEEFSLVPIYIEMEKKNVMAHGISLFHDTLLLYTDEFKSADMVEKKYKWFLTKQYILLIICSLYYQLQINVLYNNCKFKMY